MRKFERLPEPPDPDGLSAEERADFDAVVNRTTRVHGQHGNAAKYFGALLNSPPLGAILSRFGTCVRQGQLRGTYSDAERELMDIVFAVALDSNAILPIHIPDAIAVGVRPEAIAAILDGRDERLNEAERQLVEFGRHFIAGTVTNELYEGLRLRFGVRGAVEFVVLCAFLLMTVRLWQALGVPEPNDAEVRKLLDDILAGRRGLPDRGARIG